MNVVVLLTHHYMRYSFSLYDYRVVVVIGTCMKCQYLVGGYVS